VALNNFENKKIAEALDSLFSSIQQADGLILDVRNNGGILGYLTDKPFKLSWSKA
jgi:C-terminal processing protease CtpA/Prc